MTEQNPQGQQDPQGQGAPAGGQPGQQGAPGGQQPPADPSQGAQPEPNGTDWKAFARKWEKLAKDNKAKADLWDAREANEPTVASLQKQVDELKADAAAAKAESARLSAVAKVSQDTGVPAALIQGDDEEAMKASAEAIAAFAKAQAPGYPGDKGGGAGGAGMSVESIEQIKDPVKRIQARARNIELYR